MSNSDGFIDEVTEEVRRDRLFSFFRRWAWLAVLLVLLLVGGAAWNEWRLSNRQAEAEARGDALLLARDSNDAAALIAADPVLGALLASDPAALDRLAANEAADPLYRDLAVLRVAGDPGTGLSREARISQLESIASPGAPYSLLAEERIALLEAEGGDRDSAVERLRRIAQDASASAGLRQRAQQAIVALGGQEEPA